MKATRRAFVLLEVLPALALLLAVVAVSFRFLWMAAGIRDARAREREAEAALVAVWHAWEAQPGNVALARRGAGGRWEVNGFPGEEWLPAAETGPEAGGVVLRRRETSGEAGRLEWQVSLWTPAAVDGRVWRPLTTITRNPPGGPGAGEPLR
jgi:hypothetical protein